MCRRGADSAVTQQAQPTNVLPASILLVAIASGSLLLMEEPFKSGRHSETAATSTLVAPSTQMVDARLWQDPLPLIRSDWRRVLSEIDESELEVAADDATDAARLQLTLPNDELPTAIVDFREDIADEAARLGRSSCEQGQPQILVLPTLLPGSNYSNDVEVRRRSRYALISALTSVPVRTVERTETRLFPGAESGAVPAEDAAGRRGSAMAPTGHGRFRVVPAATAYRQQVPLRQSPVEVGRHTDAVDQRGRPRGQPDGQAGRVTRLPDAGVSARQFHRARGT